MLRPYGCKLRLLLVGLCVTCGGCSWETRYSAGGRPYFVHLGTGASSWTAPWGDEWLPHYGWEVRRDFAGRRYFVDHNTMTTTWADPRIKWAEMSGLATMTATCPDQVAKKDKAEPGAVPTSRAEARRLLDAKPQVGLQLLSLLGQAGGLQEPLGPLPDAARL